MDNNNIDARNYSRSNTFTQVILRFVTSAVILAITAFFTPGFTINNIWALALAAVVLTVIDFLLVKFTGLHASAFGKGFVGFVLAAVVLYATQFFVAGYSISWIAAMIGASAALSISDIPFGGPTAAVNVGLVDGKIVINPTEEQRKVSDLTLTVAGTEEKIAMIEAGAN